MRVVPGEYIPEITKLEFSPRPWWIRDTTATTILVATFADGKRAWVGWRFVAIPENASAKNVWHYLMALLACSVGTLEHIYLRDIKKVPRFQRVEHYPVTGIE